MSTINTTISHGITLGTSGVYASPLTITGTGAVEASTSTAIYAPSSLTAAVANSGTILSPGAYLAVELEGGGYLTNSASGYIGSGGVFINSSASTVANSGRIVATTGDGVDVTAGAIINSGTLVGGSDGAFLSVGGNISNTATAGLIAGRIGANIAGTGGTLTNFGTIIGTSSEAVAVSGGGTVLNSGTILAIGAGGAGIFLPDGGSVTNSTTTALIRGAGGISIAGAAGTVTNSGTIIGASTIFPYAGISLDAGGAVINSGTILSPSHANYTVVIAGGGYLTNSQSGYIGSGGVSVTGSAGTVVNQGRIVDTTGVGVNLAAGGTLTNAGTIGGGAGTAVAFGGGGNRVVVDPGAVFTGIVYGGTGGSVLEFGSAAATGTLSGLYTNYVGFGTITVDAGAQWVVSGDDIVGTGVTFDNFGTLTLSGTLTDRGVLVNYGLIEGPGSLIVDPPPGDATISTVITHGITLAASGTYGSPLTITSSGGVEAPGGAAAIYGPATNAWTVTNQGVISGPSDGILLMLGGYVGNSANGLIQGNYGIVMEGAPGTVTNSSTIVGTNGGGVFLAGGGSVANTGGFIEGAGFSVVYIGGTVGTVTNSGTILARNRDFEVGVNLAAGGSINNSGLIEAAYYRDVGVLINTATGTVTNSGTIVVTGLYTRGVLLNAGGSVGNYAGLIEGSSGIEILGGVGRVTNTGTIIGTAGVGVFLVGGGTVVDSGTINGGTSGGNITAIYFRGTSADLVVLDPGYRLDGKVIGSTTLGATNTLELGGSLGAPLAVNYGGLTLTDFQDVRFGAGGNDTLTVSSTGGTVAVTISGFTLTSDIIDLGSIGTNGSITGQSGTLVTVAGSLGSETLKLDSSDAGHFTATSDGGTGTDLGVACFCRGTRVLTDQGEVAVEDLAIGDRVVTLAGAARKIKWIGRRAYDGRFIDRNPAVLPICIAAGALGDGVPARDLWVSPEHALYIDGVLAPAGLLRNGATIRQAESVERLEYFHLELDRHDAILAEGAAAESFVDCDNRLMFQNAGEFARLYPADTRPPWRFCAPRVAAGSAELAAIRAALLERAEQLGHILDLHPDPDLHLIVDGRAIWPDSIAGERYRFHIAAGAAAVWLASRSAVPAEIEAGSRDTRRLGVPLERLALFDGERSIEAGHGDGALGEGFHADEELQRWTNGRARLPDAWLRAFPGAVTLEVHLVPTGLAYRVPPTARIAAAA